MQVMFQVRKLEKQQWLKMMPGAVYIDEMVENIRGGAMTS
jgi:hypothetical protein